MKKLFALALALVLSVSLLAGMSATAAAENDEPSGEEAVETVWYGDGAWGVLNPYIYSDSGEIIRDDFAGAWVDPENEHYFYFALTPDADIDFYRNILEERDDYELVTLKYSLKTLLHMRDVVFDRCKDIMSGTGVFEDENLIDFEVHVSEEEENGRIAAEMLKIKNEENLPDGIENAFKVTYGIWCIPAGDAVQVPAEGKICTEE